MRTPRFRLGCFDALTKKLDWSALPWLCEKPGALPTEVAVRAQGYLHTCELKVLAVVV